MASITQTTTTLSATSVNSLVYNSNLALRTATISAITVVAFLGNLLLLITIALSAKFRSLPLNHYIISLSITNLLTCIFPMPTVIGYAITSTWDFGDTMCNVLGHFLFTSSITMCAGITAMNVDRAIAVNHSYRYDHRVTLKRTRIVIIVFWVIAVFLPLPLGAGLPAAPVKPFPHRYICSITAGSNLDYIIALYLIGYGVPCIINIASFFYIAKKALNERDVGNDSSALDWMDVKGAGYVFVLFMLWVVGEIPYIILTSVEQYHSSTKMNMPLQYPDTLDTILTWLKFCHAAVLPFATFRWRRELWTKLKDLVLCRKSNSVTDASPRQEKTNNKGRPKAASQARKGKFASNVPNVPTLYATKDGLHVQGNIEEGEGEEEICGHSDFDLTIRSRDEPIPPITLRHTLNSDQEDTSDYETDRFSQSDPVSVKSTISQSDANKSFRRKAHSVSTDSGVSSAQNSYSSSGKKKKKRTQSVIEQTLDDNETSNNIQMKVIADINHQISDLTHETHPISSQLDYAETNIDQSPDAIVRLDDEPQMDTQRRKKKRKKRKAESLDAETNTTVTTQLESIRPPARLAPLDPETISKMSSSAPQTPPLRSRVAHTHRPSSLLTEPVITENFISDDQKPPLPDSEVERLEKKKKKKRKKKRDSENESDRGLMSSGASTVISSENPAFDLL